MGKALFSAWIEACTIKGIKIGIGRLKAVRKVALERILVLESFYKYYAGGEDSLTIESCGDGF